jgi:tetratricopeptide (TPR) repeat protein
MAWFGWFLLGAALTATALALVYQVPAVKYRLEWRLDEAGGIVRGWLHPGMTVPVPAGAATERLQPIFTPPPSPTPQPNAPVAGAPTPAPTPLPPSVSLDPPKWEKQDWNNCGPATLSLALRFYGWKGNQFDISSLLKPDRGDKNVNIDELVYFVRTHAGWLDVDYRVGGSLERLKAFLAAGFPVVVEKGMMLDPGDGGGGWAGHYLLLTGYDDTRRVFIGQDTNKGPDQAVPYDELEDGWRAFNHVYLYLYPPEQQPAIDAILGPDADRDANRQAALEAAGREADADPNDAYAWFDLGANLAYFERYAGAAAAFDTALRIGLPWRFTRYQFGPYIAYFNVGRFQDVIDLADSTLARTPKSEEALLWRGWARYKQGEVASARGDFQAALAVNPNYQDARYALGFVGGGG